MRCFHAGLGLNCNSWNRFSAWRVWRWQPGQRHPSWTDWKSWKTLDLPFHCWWFQWPHFCSLIQTPHSPAPSSSCSLSSHSSSPIFTVSLSDSVVETCHSGLPKGRTPVLPCALCEKKKKRENITFPLRRCTCRAAATWLTLLSRAKNTQVYLHTQSRVKEHVIYFLPRVGLSWTQRWTRQPGACGTHFHHQGRL